MRIFRPILSARRTADAAEARQQLVDELAGAVAEHSAELETRTEDPGRRAKLRRQRLRAEADAAELAKLVAQACSKAEEVAV